MDTWSEQKRRRFYRVCLNIFNKKPDRGVSLLIKNGFVGTNPKELAHFFLTRRGLSRTKIGEFLGTMGSKYHEDVLESYVSYIDFADMEIDVALRNLLEYFALPGEAQKIEKILFVFSKTYVNCNGKNSQFITDADDAHILSFAIIMLNTDLHTPNLKASKRMKVEDFVKNITAIDNLSTICPNYLRRLYNRIKQEEFQPARDHVTQVVDVDKSVIGKDKPKLVEPYRRLICYCRLQQVNCISKKQNAGAHLREIFLFNDLILIVKILNRKKDEPQYTLRYWASLNDIKIEGFESQYYKHGIMINDSNGQQTILNARTNSDKIRFVNDVRESILECNEMERVRIEMELTKQNNTTGNTGNNLGFEIANFSLNTDRQRDSGLSDSSALNSVSSICPSTSSSSGVRAPGTAPPIRRLSFNSLDSGMAEEACELSIEH
uniref:SEC7 domain-containing protein n=1 Tax=Rhabditophanes sp. KR3021 TaxID=114890 RepID=A0AC35U6L5_9BILA